MNVERRLVCHRRWEMSRCKTAFTLQAIQCSLWFSVVLCTWIKRSKNKCLYESQVFTISLMTSAARLVVTHTAIQPIYIDKAHLLSHPAPLQILTPPIERTSRLAPSKQSSLTPNNQHVSSRFELTSPLHLFACQVPANDRRPAASALVVDVSHFIGYIARAAVVRAIFELKEERRKETYMWLGNPLLYARIPGTQNKVWAVGHALVSDGTRSWG